MDTYLKLGSVKNDNKNCNCITPFYINDMQGINPNTGRNYSSEDEDIMKTALYRISNAKNCNINVCCDPNNPASKPDPAFTKDFLRRFPKIMPMYDRSTITSIKLSTRNVQGPGWIVPPPYLICKITKATINDTTDPTIKMATNLVNDCFTNQCSSAEQITLDNLLQNSKVDMKYTAVDDARVQQAILEGNIIYVKEYIAKYKVVDSPLTNDTYNNRMIHIASQGKNIEILTMLIALKANINIKNNMEETPLHFAVLSKNIDNIDVLLTQGADASLKNINGETPMFYAMKTGSLSIINILYNNNSPLLGIDKSGNNLIHYCIKYCPSFKENTDDTSGNITDSLNKSNKKDIIKFLIDRGIDSELLNNDGITPLELTQRQINRELNKECALGIDKENQKINEVFFDIKPLIEEFTSKPTKNAPSNAYGASSINKELSKYTTEHKNLLEIQTLLFNNVIKNNPKKYSEYISVDDIPKGSPIEVLDTVCVGNGMTGNEDSDECVANGGQIVKIQNRTTKIKLELIPEDDTIIDGVNQNDLYLKKIGKKVPKGTIPSSVKNYNKMITHDYTNNNQIPQTTSMTYNIGTNSTNILGGLESSLGFNPQPTANTIKTESTTDYSTGSSAGSSAGSNDNSTTPTMTDSIELVSGLNLDHPSMFNDYDDVVHKCKKDAINNSLKIIPTQQSKTSSYTNPFLTNPYTTDPYNADPKTTIATLLQSTQSFFNKYKTMFILFGVVILLLIIGIVIYHFYSGQDVKSVSVNI